MALITVDDSLNTGIRFFDDNNRLLIDALNIIDEKIRFGADRDDMIKAIKDFEKTYEEISGSGSSFMETYGYENAGYVSYMHAIQKRFIEQQNSRVINNKINVTKEYIFQLKEIVMNVISGDKNCANFLQRKYRGKINEIF